MWGTPTKYVFYCYKINSGIVKIGMEHQKEQWLQRLDDLISQADNILEGQRATRTKTQLGTIVGEEYDRVSSNSYFVEGKSLLKVIYTDATNACLVSFGNCDPNISSDSLKNSKGVLEVVRKEVQNDWIRSNRSLVVADIFSDHLAMAEYLLEKKFKDAAAVMIGSTLELHLRELSKTNGLAVSNAAGKPNKANLLNDNLVKAHVYDAMNNKLVLSWLGIRNEAAHGNYANYTQEQGENMAHGVAQFITQTPLK